MYRFILYEVGGVWQARICEFRTMLQAAEHIFNRDDFSWQLWDKERKTWVKRIELILCYNNLKPEDVLKKPSWKQEGF